MEKKANDVEICESCEVHENLLKIVNETIPAETELYDLAELFKVFGDSIISNLIGGCKCRFGWESSLNDNVFFDITPSYNQVTKTFCV